MGTLPHLQQEVKELKETVKSLLREVEELKDFQNELYHRIEGLESDIRSMQINGCQNQ